MCRQNVRNWRESSKPAKTRDAELLVYDNIAAQNADSDDSSASLRRDIIFTAQQEPLEDPFNRILEAGVRYCSFMRDDCLGVPFPCSASGFGRCSAYRAPGPPFFVRPRGGPQNTEFQMLKFRSMLHREADAATEARQAQPVETIGSTDSASSSGVRAWTSFPNFGDVLCGEKNEHRGAAWHLICRFTIMNLAKSRSVAYRTRFMVKPGITGLAQVRGLRGEIISPVLLRLGASRRI